MPVKRKKAAKAVDDDTKAADAAPAKSRKRVAKEKPAAVAAAAAPETAEPAPAASAAATETAVAAEAVAPAKPKAKRGAKAAAAAATGAEAGGGRRSGRISAHQAQLAASAAAAEESRKQHEEWLARAPEREAAEKKRLADVAAAEAAEALIPKAVRTPSALSPNPIAKAGWMVDAKPTNATAAAAAVASPADARAAVAAELITRLGVTPIAELILSYAVSVGVECGVSPFVVARYYLSGKGIAIGDAFLISHVPRGAPTASAAATAPQTGTAVPTATWPEWSFVDGPTLPNYGLEHRVVGSGYGLGTFERSGGGKEVEEMIPHSGGVFVRAGTEYGRGRVFIFGGYKTPNAGFWAGNKDKNTVASRVFMLDGLTNAGADAAGGDAKSSSSSSKRGGANGGPLKWTNLSIENESSFDGPTVSLNQPRNTGEAVVFRAPNFRDGKPLIWILGGYFPRDLRAEREAREAMNAHNSRYRFHHDYWSPPQAPGRETVSGVEVFDPETIEFVRGDSSGRPRSMCSARTGFHAIAFDESNGADPDPKNLSGPLAPRVFVLGGRVSHLDQSKFAPMIGTEAEYWDCGHQQWIASNIATAVPTSAAPGKPRAMAALLRARGHNMRAFVHQLKIYLFGGEDPTDSIDVYDIATNSWSVFETGANPVFRTAAGYCFDAATSRLLLFVNPPFNANTRGVFDVRTAPPLTSADSYGIVHEFQVSPAPKWAHVATYRGPNKHFDNFAS